MGLYPLFLCIEGRLCVVVGAGEVALRKISSLRGAGAIVKVIAPDEKEIEGVEHIRRRYEKGDLSGACLVIAATDDEDVNREVFEEAKGLNIPVNVVDNPPLCTFYVPSVVKRGDLQIAISTGGKCPALAKRIRKELEGIFGEEYKTYVELMDEARKGIIKRFPENERKERINMLLGDSGIKSLAAESRIDEARKRIESIVSGT